MAQETSIPKKRRGPAPTGQGTPIMVRVHPHLLAALDAFRAGQVGDLSRPEAVRLLVSDGLKAGGHLIAADADEGIRPDQLNSENDG